MSDQPLFDMRTRAAILMLGFASGLPSELLLSTFQTRLVDAGLKPAEIGMLVLVTLPSMLKALWAPLVDRWNPGLGRRRGWMVIALLVMAPAPMLVGAADPTTHLSLVVSAAVLVAFASATLDLAINGFTCESVDERTSAAGAGLSVWGYRAAALASSMGALWLAQHAGWTWSYMGMGLAALICVGAVLWAREPAPRGEPPATIADAISTPLRAFWRDLGPRGLVIVLLFALLFRLADSWAGNQTGTFLRSAGFDKDTIGFARGPVALLASGAGVLIAGWLGTRFSVGPCLLIAGLVGALSNLIFVAIDRGVLIGPLGLDVAMAVEAGCGGCMSAIFVGFLIRQCGSSCAATQYALLTAVWLLGRFLTAPAGYIAEQQGW
ncbi:MAG: MFS transporter, partial [Planctomycetota bacterium]